MRALREPVGAARARILEPAEPVDPWAAGVDHRASRDRHRLAGLAVEDLGAGDAAAEDAQRRHLGVVQDRGARLGRGAHVREAESSVVRRRVAVDAAGTEAVEPQVGDAAARALGLEQTAEPVACEQRVEGEAEPDRGRPERAVAVERDEERNAPDEVRRSDAQERAALVVRLADEPEVAHP